ncbi:hypothetical protein Trydic_g7693 [Trypoxylus dichotomus]
MNFIDYATVIVFCMSSIHAKPAEINLFNNTKEMKNSVACRPRKVFVEILPDTNNIQPRISGRVVQVKRCMGFDGITHCVPIKSINVTVKVNLVGTNASKTFLIPQHTRCKTKKAEPKVKSQTCPEGRKWNEKTLRCECYSLCTSGSYFDKKSCSCLQRDHSKRTRSKT